MNKTEFSIKPINNRDGASEGIPSECLYADSNVYQM